jgi:hypothetical protein
LPIRDFTDDGSTSESTKKGGFGGMRASNVALKKHSEPISLKNQIQSAERYKAQKPPLRHGQTEFLEPKPIDAHKLSLSPTKKKENRLSHNGLSIIGNTDSKQSTFNFNNFRKLKY